VYARRLDGETYRFIVSGMLWRNSFIMNDRETESDWSHITGECLRGPLKGRRLEAIPAVQTTWSKWIAQHPDTRLLRKSEEIRNSHYASYFEDESRAGIFRTTWLQDRLSAKTKVHGVARGPFAAAVTDEKMRKDGVVLIDLGEEEIRLERGRDGGVRAFIQREDGQTDEIPVGVYFWFAWSAFHPNTEVID
jgi:hypothetical protein